MSGKAERGPNWGTCILTSGKQQHVKMNKLKVLENFPALNLPVLCQRAGSCDLRCKIHRQETKVLFMS